ncbi:Gfo/Idh/MocA family protein [Gimesia algae]|uniref:Gfo/Idh/MocA family protein n=1 Tax=Gimesia algae TaxID=2527971 RepID=UPI001E5B23EE|nr:Gfo/Idh/MocA family oxidoreductase [Gimesia algae]
MSENASEPQSNQSRRKFMKQSLATLATTGLVVNPALTSGAFAASTELIKVGLVGCGGRGTGAAAQTLRADSNVELVAMADAFGDHLEQSYQNLKKTEVQDRVKVDADHKFVGFDAFQKLIDSGVDLVILATPPHFRPQQLQACIDADKHVFCEKPVAVDAPGIRSVLKTTAEAKKKNLTIVSGLCWRYEPGMQQMVDKIHEGGIGDIVALHSTRYLGGVAKMVKRKPEWSDMEYQMRNWYYYTWLSGDFNTEQFVHELDK